MNSSFGKLPKTLEEESERVFLSGSGRDVFCLLYRYLQFVEDDNEGFLHLFLLENPLERKQSMDDFNAKCLGFLKRSLKEGNTAHPYDATLSEAQTYMGLAYELGLFGLRRNARLALSYYSAAARQNHPIGTFRMGQCFEKGIGKARSHRRALDFYRCSAKLGYVVGMHIYGSVLLHGDLDNKRDLQSGLFYLKLAVRKADESYPFPYYDLAQVYELSTDPDEIQPDTAYALRIYSRGARLGCPNCQYRMAKCHEIGELGESRSLGAAVEWYRKAASLGHVDAQATYSRLLFTGIDHVLQPSAEQSFFWALKAAVRMHPQAAFSVAEFVEGGFGTRKSTFLALWWYTVAHESGHTQARSKLTTLKLEIDMRNEGVRESRCCGCLWR